MTVVTVPTPSVADPDPGRRRSILATARVEAGRMARHPAVLIGLAAGVAQNTLGQGPEEWGGQAHYLSVTSWSFVWIGALCAAALTAGRQRILADTELFPATPSTPGDRVLGTALGLVGPALLTALAVAVAAVLNAREGGFLHGDDGYSRAFTPSFFEWAQPVLLVVMAGVVGIALAQLRRGRLVALVVAVVLVFFGGTIIWAFQMHPVRVLHPFMFPSYEQSLGDTFDPAGWSVGDPPLLTPGEFESDWRAVHFDTAALGWHLVYLSGLALLGVWIAARLADRDERSSRIRWIAVAGLPLVLVGGVTQVLTAGVAS